jgi:hypothetical protein
METSSKLLTEAAATMPRKPAKDETECMANS